MIRTALSSAAFLGASADQVLDAARLSGVNAVEWSCDGFIERGDAATAADLMLKTLKAGLSIAAYSTIYRIGLHSLDEFGRLLSTARNLQAPLVRLWSAPGLSGCYDERKKADEFFIDQARYCGDLAGQQGITLCLSPARNSLLSNWDRSANLLTSINHPFVKLAWEPSPDLSFDDSMQRFTRLSGQIGLIVARQYSSDGTIHSLVQRDEDWSLYLDAFDEQGGDSDMVRYVVIRAIKDGLAENLHADVALIKYYSEQLRRYYRRRIY